MEPLVRKMLQEITNKKNADKPIFIKTKTRCVLEVVNEAPYYTLTGIDQVFSIHLEVFWRVLSDSRVIFSSEDDNQKFGLDKPFTVIEGFERQFAGLHLKEVEVKRPVSDLTFHFENGRKLEVFVSSGGYEGWSLHGDGLSLICLGGGEISIFER